MRCVYEVSTDNQAEKVFNSCEAQKEKISAFIKSQENMGVCKIYSDAGYTRASMEWPRCVNVPSAIPLWPLSDKAA